MRAVMAWSGGEAQVQRGLANVEGLGATLGGIAFDAAQAGQRLEGVAGEPAAASLAGQALEQDVALALQLCTGEGHEEVGPPQVPVELRDLVFEDQLVAKGVPGQ